MAPELPIGLHWLAGPGIMRRSQPVDRAAVIQFPHARQPRASYFAVIYVAVCLVLAVLAFLPQDTSPVFYEVLYILMLPISTVALLVTLFVGVLVFGPGDLPTWARVAEALLWTALATVQALGALSLCRLRSTRPQPD
jgi:hypothetical protein